MNILITKNTVDDVLVIGRKKTHHIHRAAEAGDIAAVRRCLDLNTRVSVFPDSKGRTPLHHAAANGHYEVVRLLAKQHNSETWDLNQETPLSSALNNGHTDVVKLLVTLLH